MTLYTFSIDFPRWKVLPYDSFIPANSHALGVSLTPAGWKLRSHAGSRLRANFSRLIQKCELLPSWLTQLLKICSSNPCKERKPCVKWINNNSFLVISDFWSEKHLKRARVYTRPKTSDVFGRLRTSSEDFRLLRKTSYFFGNLRKWSCLLQKSHVLPGEKSHAYISQKVGRYTLNENVGSDWEAISLLISTGSINYR